MIGYIVKNIKIYKKLLIILLLLFVLLVFWGWSKMNKDKEQVSETKIEQPKEHPPKKSKKKISYSRVTFFHHLPIKASLAIPETWEGKYRIEEKDDEARFYYIGNIKNPQLLFRILAFKKSEWENFKHKNNFKKIKEKEGYVFVWQKANEKVSTSEEYFDMMSNIEDIISSFKDFKL